jgi:hypothetical protein
VLNFRISNIIPLPPIGIYRRKIAGLKLAILTA